MHPGGFHVLHDSFELLESENDRNCIVLSRVLEVLTCKL